MTDAAASPAPAAAYPPEHHFLRDLDSASVLVAVDRNLVRAPLTDGVRAAGGQVALGFLAALVDIAAAPVALFAGTPDWTATQGLSLHATGWLTEGPVVVDARLVRAGKNTVIVAVDVYDGAGTEDLVELRTAIDDQLAGQVSRAATGVLTFARIPRSASAAATTFKPEELVGQPRSMAPARPPQGTMLERIGVEVVDADAGAVQIAHRDYVRNSFGTINGGVLGAVFQAAAEACRPGLVASDLQVHYLAQTKAGPARTSCVVSRDADDHSIVTARAVDAGNDDQVLALATVTLQRPPT
jgi:acyl-coenzyme A thioesterase PaaI-like protein